jgi:hypothetical protein
MKRAALAVIAITLATPSAAACRKHAIWKYPWPQRCYTAYAPEALQHRAGEQDRDWTVEITKLPPTWNLDEPRIEVTAPETVQDPDRARGLNKLKEQLK